MTKHFRTLKADVWLPHRFAVGHTFELFYDGLKGAKLFGNRCSQCNRVFVPPRSFCPDCYKDITEWRELPQEGRIVSWTVAAQEYYGAPHSPPFIIALIRLDSADTDFIHFLGGVDGADLDAVRRSVRIGDRVKAVWQEVRTGSLKDLKWFELNA